MAFLHVHRRRCFARARLPRIYRARQTLEELTESDLKCYRISRARIEQLIDGFSQSEWANSTNRAMALSAETQVSSKRALKNAFKFICVSFQLPVPAPAALELCDHNVPIHK